MKNTRREFGEFVIDWASKQDRKTKKNVKFPKTKRKSSRSKIKVLLRLWGKIIFLRDCGICQYCRCPVEFKRRNPHHIVERGTGVRPSWFLTDNGILLCVRCHLYHAHGSMHARHAFEICLRAWLRKRGIDYDAIVVLYSARGGVKSCLDLYERELLKEAVRHGC